MHSTCKPSTLLPGLKSVQKVVLYLHNCLHLTLTNVYSISLAAATYASIGNGPAPAPAPATTATPEGTATPGLPEQEASP